jgi:hypothetical protein
VDRHGHQRNPLERENHPVVLCRKRMNFGR